MMTYDDRIDMYDKKEWKEELSLKDRVRAHFATHKNTYIWGCVGLAGITGLIVGKKNTGLLGGPDPRLLSGPGGLGRVVVNNTTRSSPISFLSKVGDVSTVNNAYTSIHTGTRGASGFVTKSLDTGELFQTQGAAAEAFGIPASILSSHLNGKMDDACGFHFERVGVL